MRVNKLTDNDFEFAGEITCEVTISEMQQRLNALEAQRRDLATQLFFVDLMLGVHRSVLKEMLDANRVQDVPAPAESGKEGNHGQSEDSPEGERQTGQESL